MRYNVSLHVLFPNLVMFSCFSSQVIDGNGDTIDSEEVTHFIDEPIRTRFVRFEIDSFAGMHPCMSVQVYACAPGNINSGYKQIFQVHQVV